MTRSWNNVVTSDGYQEFRFNRTQRVTFAVSNAPILARFAFVTGGGQLQDQAYDYEPTERDMQNGSAWTWDAQQDFNARGIVGVMIKSEIAGTPAVVTIHA